jgi:hypothetical protein
MPAPIPVAPTSFTSECSFWRGAGQVPWQRGWRGLPGGSPHATVAACLPPSRPASWRSSRCWSTRSAAASTAWFAASTRSAATRRPAPSASPVVWQPSTWTSSSRAACSAPATRRPRAGRRGWGGSPRCTSRPSCRSASPSRRAATTWSGRSCWTPSPRRPRTGSCWAAATRIAAARGRELGAGFRQARALGRVGPGRALAAATEPLEEHGYEPRRLDQRTVELRNCPFHTLARKAPEVVCAINRSLLEGLLRGLGDQRVEAVLAPRPDACCVELRAPRSR